MWPGYDVRLVIKEAGLFLNIDPCYKVIRFETALEFLQTLRNNCNSRGLDFVNSAKKEFAKMTVITRYNNKSYPVNDIAWDMSPDSKFTDSEGKSVSFKEYYAVRYNEDIKDREQPLLVSDNRRTGR